MRLAARCRPLLALLAACGSPQPSGTAPPPAAPSPADAAPPPSSFVQQKGCLPDEDPAAEPTDAGPETPPKVVTGSTLEALRVSGRRDFEPAPQHRRPLWRRHRRGFAVAAKYCVDVEGRVVSVRLLQDSGYPPYDEQVTQEISCWRFRPLVIGGTPTRACSIVTFVYRTSPPSFAPPAP